MTASQHIPGTEEEQVAGENPVGVLRAENEDSAKLHLHFLSRSIGHRAPGAAGTFERARRKRKIHQLPPYEEGTETKSHN